MCPAHYRHMMHVFDVEFIAEFKCEIKIILSVVVIVLFDIKLFLSINV